MDCSSTQSSKPLCHLFPIAKFSELKIESLSDLNNPKQTPIQRQQQLIEKAWVHHCSESSTDSLLYFQIDYTNANDFSSYLLTVIKIRNKNLESVETMLRITISELMTESRNDAYKFGSMNLSQTIRFNVKFPIVGCKYIKSGILNRFQINFLQKQNFDETVNLFSKAGANLKDIGLLQTQQCSQFSQVITNFPTIHNNDKNSGRVQTQKQQTGGLPVQLQQVSNTQSNVNNQNEMSSVSEISYGFQQSQATHYSTLPYQLSVPPKTKKSQNILQNPQSNYENVKKTSLPENRTLQNVNSIENFSLYEQKNNGQIPTPNQTCTFIASENNFVCQESPRNSSLNLDRMVQSNVNKKIEKYIESYFEQLSSKSERRLIDNNQISNDFNNLSQLENTDENLKYQTFQKRSGSSDMISSKTHLHGFPPKLQSSEKQASSFRANETVTLESYHTTKKRCKKARSKQKSDNKTFKAIKKLDLRSQVVQFKLLESKKQVKVINKFSIKNNHDLFDELSPDHQAAVFEKCAEETKQFLQNNMSKKKLFALNLERQLQHLKALVSRNDVAPLIADIKLKYGMNTQYIERKISEKKFVEKVVKLNEFLALLTEKNDKQGKK